MIDWSELKDAYEFVRSGKAQRVDNVQYIIYRVGIIVRIDIKDDA